MRESIFSVELQKILHKVGQQSYTPVTSKEPEDSRKFGSTQNNLWDTEESVQKACFENFNPWVIKRNTFVKTQTVCLLSVHLMALKIFFNKLDRSSK